MHVRLELVDDTSILVYNSPCKELAGKAAAPKSSQESPSKKPRLDREVQTKVKVEESNQTEEVVVKKECENHTLLDSIRNPKIKVKTERALSDKTLASRLSEIQSPPFNSGLPREIQDFVVPREFISSIYGGNTQETFPLIGKRFVHQHGLNDFMFPNLDYNPAAPQVPGAPGLYFETSPEREDKRKERGLRTHRVITRLETKQWLYMGQYSLTKTTPLTVAEWAEQKQIFRDTWCREICNKAYGRKVLTRIAARERFKCSAPDDNQLFSVQESGEWRELGQKDVQRAFDRGEENFVIYRMICHDYDAEFQKNLFERFKTWTPPSKKSKKAKNGRAGDKGKPAAKPGKGA